MIQMQRLQPEMKRLQLKYKDDRQKLNEELMAFYKENNLNPLGGCLPLLLQTPIFIILYNVIRGLTYIPDGPDTFDPKYLDHTSELYQDLDGADRDDGVRRRPGRERQQGAAARASSHGLPHVVLVAIVAVTSYYQQKQIQGRNPNAEIPPQQKMLMRLMPAMFVFFAFVAPSALVVYFVVVEPLPDRHAGLHHPNPLPRRGLARRPGPAGRRRGQEAQGGERRRPRPAPPARQAGRGRRAAAEATTPRPPTAPPATDGDQRRRATAPRPPPPPDRPHDQRQNRSKKKKKRR